MRLIDQLRDAKTLGQYQRFQEQEMESEMIPIQKRMRPYLKYCLDICCHPDLPVIDLTDIADYLAEDFTRFKPRGKEIMIYAVPPFSICWMEFTSKLFDARRCGVLVENIDVRTWPKDDKIRVANEWKMHYDEFTRERFEEAAWFVHATFFLASHDAVPLPFGSASLFINKIGAALPLYGIDFLCITQQDSQELIQKRNNESLNTAEALILLMPMVSYLVMNVVGVGCSFMSCHNVRMVEHQPPRHERRQREREGKPPFTKYYTLEIEPMKEILRSEGQSEKIGLKKALSLVRGNMAYYTPEKPLFGKITGYVWRPAHVRGSAEVGEIKKDYRVLAELSKIKET
jgi:hypothetical protein